MGQYGQRNWSATTSGLFGNARRCCGARPCGGERPLTAECRKAAAARAASPGRTAHFFLVVIARRLRGRRRHLVKMFTSPLNGGYNALALLWFARVLRTAKRSEFRIQISDFRMSNIVAPSLILRGATLRSVF